MGAPANSRGLRRSGDLRTFEPYARWLAHRYPLYGRAAGDEQDVMQEAMIAAWKALRIYQAGPGGSLDGFVKQRMKYRVIECVRIRSPDGQRRAESDAWPIEEWDARGPDTTVEAVLGREQLRIAAETLRELPGWQRDRLVGHLNGGSRGEMAAASGVGVGSIDQALHRGRRKLELALAA